MLTEKRIVAVAKCLKTNIFVAPYGGKETGKFSVSRENLRLLLGVQRLHTLDIQRLIDACLVEGLVVIDLDDYFAFAETVYVSKWRKLPSRFVLEYVSTMPTDADLDTDEEVIENSGTGTGTATLLV